MLRDAKVDLRSLFPDHYPGGECGPRRRHCHPDPWGFPGIQPSLQCLMHGWTFYGKGMFRAATWFLLKELEKLFQYKVFKKLHFNFQPVRWPKPSFPESNRSMM